MSWKESGREEEEAHENGGMVGGVGGRDDVALVRPGADTGTKDRR